MCNESAYYLAHCYKAIVPSFIFPHILTCVIDISLTRSEVALDNELSSNLLLMVSKEVLSKLHTQIKVNQGNAQYCTSYTGSN